MTLLSESIESNLNVSNLEFMIPGLPGWVALGISIMLSICFFTYKMEMIRVLP